MIRGAEDGDNDTGEFIAILVAKEGEDLVESIGFDHDGPLVDSFGWSDADGEGIASVEHTFDERWRVASRAINGASEVDFSYSPDGLLTQAGQAQFGHDPQTALVEERTVGDVVTNLMWSDFAEMEAMYTDASGSALFDIEFAYDKEGRIVEVTEAFQGESTTFEYDYDGRGRLVEVIRDGVQEASYSYDANDIRTGVTDDFHDLSAADIEHDDQDRLIEYGNLVFSYDERGRLTSVLDTSTSEETFYGYDIRGNLLAVDLPDGRTVRYTADATGRRVERWVEDADGEEEPDSYRRYVYKDQLNPIAVLDRDGDILQRFVYGSRAHVPDYMVTPDGTFALVTDHLGSVRLVVDVDTGEVVQRMEFDAFGQVIEDTAEGFQPFGYAGGLYEPETGLVRFGARDYDPKTGRWTAKDPIGFNGGDTNLYGYAFQDPVNLIDPAGKLPEVTLQDVSNAAAGFGDTISGGVTRKVRQALDIDAVVDRCSGWYTAGEIGGTVVSLYFPAAPPAFIVRSRYVMQAQFIPMKARTLFPNNPRLAAEYAYEARAALKHTTRNQMGPAGGFFNKLRSNPETFGQLATRKGYDKTISGSAKTNQFWDFLAGVRNPANFKN